MTIAWAALKQERTASLRHDEQTKADRGRRITESMAKAGEQLGSHKIETHLIGIYTLERIVRERAPGPPRPEAQARLATDIQAVLTVLGRRDKKVCRQDAAMGDASTSQQQICETPT